MRHLLAAISAAVTQRNWYAALSTTLALPDICGWLEDPTASSQDRYVAWFDRFVGSQYISEVGATHERHVFLSGRDCYALRCAFLHQGSEEITSQRAREALDRFKFTVQTAGSVFTGHCNQLGSKLQLQVDIFCSQFVAGGECWLRDVGSKPEITSRVSSLLHLYDFNGQLID